MKKLKIIIGEIKDFRLAWKTWRKVRHYGAMFKIVEDTFDEAQGPMFTRIAMVNLTDGKKLSNLVSLWAGIGDTNPIERAAELKQQNTELKTLLKKSVVNELNEYDRARVEVLLLLN